jgi:hypothetical protein
VLSSLATLVFFGAYASKSQLAIHLNNTLNCETMLKSMVYNTTGRCTEPYTHHFDGLEVYSAIWALESMSPKQGFAAVEKYTNMNK